MPYTAEDRVRFQRLFLILVAVGISLLFLAMIRSFVMPLLLAGIFSALVQPVYRRLLRLFRGYRAIAAGFMVVAMLLLIVGPLAAFFSILVTEAVDVSRSVRPWIEEQIRDPTGIESYLDRIPFAGYLKKIPFAEDLMPKREELFEKVGEVATRTASFVGTGLAAGTRGAARFVLQLFVMLYAMFFFLMDGPEMLRRIVSYVPLPGGDVDRMLARFTSVTRATLKGTIAIGILQGALAGLAFAVAGLKGAVFWGTIMAVLSIIPGVGVALVWVPAVVYLALAGRVGTAIALAIWCAAVVGTVDNLLRPRLVGQDTKLPDLLILISTLGGLTLFGAIGIIIGPIVAALFVTVWTLYGESFARFLSPPGAAADTGPANPPGAPGAVR